MYHEAEIFFPRFSDFVGVKVDKWSAEVDHYRIESKRLRCYDSIRGEKTTNFSVVSNPYGLPKY